MINPITRKRLHRFKETKRAYGSFWILVLLYLFSLGSEFICNSNPIYVRFDGKSYFPVFRFYPDDLFTGSGKNTRPNYKKIRDSERFQDDPSNFMVFPPVPYGPYEIIDPQSLETQSQVTVRFIPQLHVGSVNIRRDFSISRANASGFFFGTNDHDVRSLNLQDYWLLSDRLLAAIENRFNNRDAHAVSEVVASIKNPDSKARISLAKFARRTRPPKTLRLTFRVLETEDEIGGKVVFDDALHIFDDAQKFWSKTSDANKKTILNRVQLRKTQPVDPYRMVIDDKDYELRFEKVDVRWPYRPVKGHWLGIDKAGRDVLARIVYGLRISMTFGLILVFFSLLVGIVVGAIQGYYGGKIDIITQRLIEVWSALPFLYVMILLGSIFGRSFSLLLFVYGIFNWVGISYYIRAEFLKLRRQPFAEAALCLGIPMYKIIFKHILPNALIPVITFFPFSLVGAIGSLAALDYLGFGLPPPTASWGELLAQAQHYRQAWWLIAFPAISLFTVMLLGVFIGEGVREAYDPKVYHRLK